MHEEIKEILLCGSFHGKNKGDEAIAEAEIVFFQQEFPNARITIATKNPEYFSAQYGISAVSIVHPIHLLRAIHRASHVVIGGGGLFFEPHAGHAFNIVRNQSYIWPALSWYSRSIGKKVFFVGVGVENMRLRCSEWILRIGLLRAHSILVRDIASRTYLESIGVTAPIHVTADSAFLMHQSLIAHTTADSELRIGVSLHYGIAILEDAAYVDRWVVECAKAFSHFARRVDKKVVWVNVPMHPKDGDITERVFNIVRTQGHCTERVDVSTLKPSEAMNVLKQLDIHIGMRMHGAILSTVVGTPCVVLSYARKVDQFSSLLSAYDSTLAKKMFLPYADIQNADNALYDVYLHRDAISQMQRTCAMTEADRVTDELRQAFSSVS